MDIIYIPLSLVLGCNKPDSVHALIDFVEEETGSPLHLMQSGFSDCEAKYPNGYGYFYGDYYGDGWGRGDNYRINNRQGVGSGEGYGDGWGHGRGYGYGYGYLDGDGAREN